MEENKEVTAGAVRKFLGIEATHLNNDPAYKTLAEMQDAMLVDRGPFVIRKNGIPYLSKEGYPYHSFHWVHQDLVKTSMKLSFTEAGRDFLSGYLRGAVGVTDKKLFSMFKGFLSQQEITKAIEELVKEKRLSVQKIGNDNFIIFEG